MRAMVSDFAVGMAGLREPNGLDLKRIVVFFPARMLYWSWGHINTILLRQNEHIVIAADSIHSHMRDIKSSLLQMRTKRYDDPVHELTIAFEMSAGA